MGQTKHETARTGRPIKARPRPVSDIPPARSPWVAPGVAALVAAVVLVTHWPVLSAGAVSFDDISFLFENPTLQNPSGSSAGAVFAEVLESPTVAGYYEPLTLVSLMLDVAAGGTQDHLRPFHRTSLALHVLNTVLIVFLLHQLFGEPWSAGAAALLFGLHPLTVEPVAWVWERKTLLTTFFALGCLILHVRYARRGGRVAYAGSLGAFALALLAKPTSTPLPVLLLLIDFWPLRRLGTRAVLEKIPFFAVAAVSAAITVVSTARNAGIALPGGTFLQEVPAKVGYLLGFYLAKIVWPARLSSVYELPPLSLSDGLVLAGVLATCLVTVLAFVCLRWTRAVLATWVFFVVAIAPTLGLIGYSWISASDKYVYLPAIGWLLILAHLVGRARRAWPGAGRGAALRWTAGILVIGLSVAEAAATRRYLAHWRDTEGLYRHMMALAPRAPLVHNNLALELARRGRYDEAIAHYRTALDLAPGSSLFHNNLAQALNKQGRYEEAARHSLEAIRLRSDYPEAINNLGAALLGQERIGEAIEQFERAIRLKPQFEAEANLAGALARLSRFDEAADHYARALRMRPDAPDVLVGLGDVLDRLGDAEGAAASYARALRVWPESALAHRRLAYVLTRQGKAREAEAHFREALRLQPDYAETHNDLGTALIRWERRGEAIEHFARAVELAPDFVPARHNLGLALAEEGRADEAIQQLTEALRRRPDSPLLNHALGEVLLRAGRADEAVRCFRAALAADPTFEPARQALDQVSRPTAGQDP